MFSDLETENFGSVIHRYPDLTLPRDELTMFGAATEKLACEFKQTTNGKVLNVTSQLDADNCKPFHLVVKKNRKWCWQKPKYQTLPFSLWDVMKDTNPGDVKVDEDIIGKYSRTHDFKIDGKIKVQIGFDQSDSKVGAAILGSLADVEVKGSDSITVKANLGTLVKHEVNIPQLINVLDSRRIRFSHDLVEQVMSSKRILCLITQSVSSKDVGVLSYSLDVEASEEVEVKPVKPVDISETASVDTDTHNNFTIPAGMPLVYTVHELKVSFEGEADLCITSDSRGSMPERNDDSVDFGRDLSVTEMLAGLFSARKTVRDVIRRQLIIVCAVPHELHAFVDLTELEATPKIPSQGTLKTKCPETHNAFERVLDAIGYKRQSDGSVPSTSVTTLAEAVFNLLLALDELPDHAILAVAKLNALEARCVYNICNRLKEGSKVPCTDAHVAPLLRIPTNPGRLLLIDLDALDARDPRVLSMKDTSLLEPLVIVLDALFIDH